MHENLAALQRDLDAARAGSLGLGPLGNRLRVVTVPPALPPRFGEVLLQIADQLESAGLFSGESCSFSESELLDGLQAWIDRARGRLDAPRA